MASLAGGVAGTCPAVVGAWFASSASLTIDRLTDFVEGLLQGLAG